MTPLFQTLWDDYVKLALDAQKIHDVIEAKGDQVVNDHIALRTFNQSPIRVNDIAKIFIKEGYDPQDRFHFAEKHLNAQFFLHTDVNMPKVFISELIIDDFSSEFQSICNKLLGQAKVELETNDLTLPFRPWKISFNDYEKLKSESDYAAWLSAFGICANHFTVYVNQLKTINGIAELNKFLKDKGFILNDRGGELKGNREQLLMQSSTMARLIEWDFTDGTYQIPGCYYEFAERFADESDQLFQGFILESANKIFESTNE